MNWLSDLANGRDNYHEKTTMFKSFYQSDTGNFICALLAGAVIIGSIVLLVP
jgi:hypothetical protein